MLNGKTIIVTGVASGIGAETAKLLKEQGANVIGVDRNTPSVTVDAFHQVDLTDEAAIDALIETLKPLKADGLANIAGVPPTAPPEVVVTVNLVALKRLTLGLVDSLADNAAIVNLASLAGIGWEGEVAKIKAANDLTHAGVTTFCDENGITSENSYFFTKQAVVAWTHENRWTWRDRGIRMNAVSPGPVETPILKDFLETLGERAKEDSKVMDRPGRPTDIAPVVAFLLSDGAGWLRGVNIAADGGMRAHIDATSNGLA
ncbi:coniferyl-alcohol dehydrogenase [Celeribacter halophilus]|jgi:NAD(P)-dependent dehydrogenase (short-subunit alcohol dehydrogenase family)|uniref:coniferyl-alcohol dehydrogenase n=1 Tax=Celeribacter halophilus TaxID=576117 RepID=UPI0026E2E715|nr:coniferyl-alcohol dehydrogenase [Celeribacter halophilus]MDO6725211.1 coniferyl-alcohol dehydrogenase [Celeribacter halophilus]